LDWERIKENENELSLKLAPRFVKADHTFEQDAAARAYINFLHEQDIFTFRQQFDGYVFLDNKGRYGTALPFCRDLLYRTVPPLPSPL
jgi:hypothetical protein